MDPKPKKEEEEEMKQRAEKEERGGRKKKEEGDGDEEGQEEGQEEEEETGEEEEEGLPMFPIFIRSPSGAMTEIQVCFRRGQAFFPLSIYPYYRCNLFCYCPPFI